MRRILLMLQHFNGSKRTQGYATFESTTKGKAKPVEQEVDSEVLADLQFAFDRDH
jgi:hypothetical protein